MTTEHVCKDRPRIFWRSNGPLSPDIIDLNDPSLGWAEHEIDAFAADCSCEGPECDPETCPRFGDDCSCCGGRVDSGSGLLLLDGGEVYCDDCVAWVQPDELTLTDRAVIEDFDRDRP